MAERRLLFVVPYPLGTTGTSLSVTATTFTTVVGGAGLLLPSAELLSLAGPGGQTGILVRLLAKLQAPSVAGGAVAEARLAVEQDDGRLAPLDAGSIRVPAASSVASALTKRQGAAVDITGLLRTMAILGLRLQARTSVGTTLLVEPCVAFFRDQALL